MSEPAPIESAMPHLTIPLGKSVSVIPAAFFEDVAAGRRRLDDFEGDRKALIRLIVREWLDGKGMEP